MGVWGTDIFSDDTACEIRDTYRDLLGEGWTGEAAKARIVKEFSDLIGDPAESGVIWLALAAVQWKHGLLDEDTLGRALEVIDSGSDLAIWEAESTDHEKRRQSLERLREEITSQQPAEKKVEKRVLERCDWPRGSLVTFRLLSGKLTLLRVIDRFTDKGGTYPICELLDWTGTEILGKSELAKLGVRKSVPEFRPKAGYVTQLILVGLNQAMLKRFEKLDLRSKPSKNNQGQTILHRKILWSDSKIPESRRQVPHSV